MILKSSCDVKVCIIFILLLSASFVARPVAIYSPFGDYYNSSGKKIGTDGRNDAKKYIVTKRRDIRRIRRITKAGRATQERDVPSAVVLPSDAAIRESLDVLRRTEASGGLREQSSIVLKDESVIRGAMGEKPRIVNNVQTAECTLPVLPEGKTRDDVETTIHPHPTAVTFESGNLYPHSAIIPSKVDRGTFGWFTTNIIVGPLEEINLMGPRRIYGSPKLPDRLMGIAVYYHNGTRPSVTITRRAAEKIIKN
jgi:hypothetical protein